MIEQYIRAGAPEEVIAWPSMMKPEEKVVLYRLAKEHYSGCGVIVDAGVFLGASTNAFALGLRENQYALRRFGAPPGRPINSYDVAIWKSGFDRYLNAILPAVPEGMALPKHNESFESLMRALLAQHSDLVDFRIGDIVKEARSDDPVEIAFYDCLKTNERDLAAYHAFAPNYIPGKTIVVQQDYFYERGCDNKIRQEMLAPYMEFLGACANSAYFLVRAPIPADLISGDVVSTLSNQQRLTLLERAVQRAPNDKYRCLTMISVVEFLVKAGEYERAIMEAGKLNEQAASIGAKSVQYLASLIKRATRALAKTA